MAGVKTRRPCLTSSLPARSTTVWSELQTIPKSTREGHCVIFCFVFNRLFRVCPSSDARSPYSSFLFLLNIKETGNDQRLRPPIHPHPTLHPVSQGFATLCSPCRPPMPPALGCKSYKMTPQLTKQPLKSSTYIHEAYMYIHVTKYFIPPCHFSHHPPIIGPESIKHRPSDP